MRERILTLALAASGGGESERTLLEPLCIAAEDFWQGRLRKGVAPEECGEALICAAAFTAAADLTGSGGAVASFSAGDLSVRVQGGAERLKTAESLRQAAERLMEPYVRAEGFWARGVRG